MWPDGMTEIHIRDLIFGKSLSVFLKESSRYAEKVPSPFRDAPDAAGLHRVPDHHPAPVQPRQWIKLRTLGNPKIEVLLVSYLSTEVVQPLFVEPAINLRDTLGEVLFERRFHFRPVLKPF